MHSLNGNTAPHSAQKKIHVFGDPCSCLLSIGSVAAAQDWLKSLLATGFRTRTGCSIRATAKFMKTNFLHPNLTLDRNKKAYAENGNTSASSSPQPQDQEPLSSFCRPCAYQLLFSLKSLQPPCPRRSSGMSPLPWNKRRARFVGATL